MKTIYTFLLFTLVSMELFSQPRINKINNFKIIKEASLKDGIVRWSYDKFDEKWDSIPQIRENELLSNNMGENCVGITTQIATKDDYKYYFINFDELINSYEYPEQLIGLGSAITTYRYLISEEDIRSLFSLSLGTHKIKIYEIEISFATGKPLLRDEDLNNQFKWKELIVRKEDANTIRFIPPSSSVPKKLSLESNYFEVSNENWNSLTIDAEEVQCPAYKIKTENAYLDEKIYDVAEHMPSFPGGSGALMQYISSHIKYPDRAQTEGIHGRVICTFVIERDGSISDVKVMKGIDPRLDKEACRLINSMPKWIPAKQNGMCVRCKYSLPITFNL